jgi:predicted Zn finger-like uncharacterized protein
MIISCESCNTKFRLDPARFKGPRSKVRCSRCGHVFYVVKPGGETDTVFINLEDTVQPVVERKATPPPSSRAPSSTPSVAGRKKGKLRPYFLAVIAVVVVGAALFGFFRSGIFSSSSETAPPEKVADVKKVEEAAITISSATQAYFLENKHAGQLFVVEGEVVNEGHKAVSFILLEGKLYTTDSNVSQSQKAFCGNVTTREELTSLSITEIQNRMMNREGKNMVNVHVPPQGKVPFTLVFHNLPELDLLSDYSVEVISSQVD